MLSYLVSLDFGRSPAGERLALVSATKGIRCCRDGGYAALAPGRACFVVDTLARPDMVAVRRFLARANLAGVALADLEDSAVRGLLRQHIKTGNLVVLRETGSAGTDGDDSTRKLRQLVRGIESKIRGRLALSGRQYRLVADLDLDRLPDRDSYEVVGRDDASRIIDALAVQKGSAAPDLPRLLAEARDRLTRDWRPPFQPDGLVLLRRLVTLRVAGPDSSAVTPSQMKKLVTKPEWIEIVVEDQDGQPYVGRYRIELPDGTIREGTLDETGFFGNYDLDAGNCKLELLDRTKPKGSSGGGGDEPRSLPVTLGDDIRLPDDAAFVLAGGGESISIPLADKFDAAVGGYAFTLEPLRSGVRYTGTVSYGDTSTTMFTDDDLYARAGGPVDQPLDFNLAEPDHQTPAGDPAALEPDPPMQDQTHADDQQAAQIPEDETCDLVPGTFSPHVGTGGDN